MTVRVRPQVPAVGLSNRQLKERARHASLRKDTTHALPFAASGHARCCAAAHALDRRESKRLTSDGAPARAQPGARRRWWP